ncbi:MAG: hypothetical protein WC184_12605 [Acidimicrobiia bacterium]
MAETHSGNLTVIILSASETLALARALGGDETVTDQQTLQSLRDSLGVETPTNPLQAT